MSTLTKVFVILLVVFSIAFTMMTVSVVSQTTRWKDNADKYEQAAKVADTNLRNLIAANAAELASSRDTIKAQLSRIGDIENQLKESRNEIASLRAELAQAGSEKSTAEAINRGLLAQLQVVQATGEEHGKQRDELETRNIDIEGRNIDLNDRVNELTARLAVLLEEKRHFEQQINILRKDNERLATAARLPGAGGAMETATGTALTGVTAETPVAGAAVRGKVLEIEGDILTVSVGSADGVKEGMVFVIHRAGQYVGDLTVSVVDPDRSAGRLSKSVLEPRISDQITDARWLGSSSG